ncbi:Mrp/NBP35 family ATP-binding protein [Methanocella arvoryzae]|uniref:Iron-sulfur cluster carrier protein n=1 Tax=Methanocella arvoryzae (strain DSM 22066 / NBRC 105507 / MRE50) TaxID=351160 RepID=Q0W534_METAR|nr:Mrp/NBP35 family ATP-binding protein [Methanocella arvoryzae]CAJ36509.1 conserved ATPase (Mrp family) [Methanocella arvoryzae MRE50]
MSDTNDNTLSAPECSSCKDGKGSSKCASCPSASPEMRAKKSETEQQIEQRLSKVKHRIAIVSGKGGVGKSTVTASMALSLSMLGKKVGVLDADVSGPNIPHLLGLEGRKLEASMEGLEPIMNRNGIKVISSEFVLTTSDTPMLWRGPMRTTLVTQFVTDTNWGELDYLLIDLPPGTGDEPMSVMQQIPLDGIVIVSTSSNLSVLDVSKIINMAKTINVPVLGLIENMSYMQCPDCDRKIRLFGESKVERLAKQYGLRMIGEIPLDPLNSGVDELPADGRSLIVTAMKPIAQRVADLAEKHK